jgi:retinol dehydrogenase 12
MFTYVITPIVVYVAYKAYCKWTCGMCKCVNDMKNKVVIVTGSNTGIGYETAKDLARRGAKVILACRDVDKGIAARNNIVTDTGNRNVIFKKVDFTSFRSVRAFANDIIITENEIHVLVNNAGTGRLDNSLTEDNLPIETQVNHFSPFLLSQLLLPLIKSSAPSRIINVSSILHRFGKIDLDNFDKQATSYEHVRVYSDTKLANMLFTRKLSQDLIGSGVTVNCLHPGAVSTEIFRHKPLIIRFLFKLLMKTPYEGAQTSIYLSVAPELDKVTGKYFQDCKEVTPSNSALDDDLAQKLWDLSEKCVSEKKKNA